MSRQANKNKAISTASLLKMLMSAPAVLILYLYDDVLWGPAPIAVMTQLFGKVPGIIGLSLIYLVVSWVASYVILTRYRRTSRRHNVKTNESSLQKHQKIQKMLESGQWAGLAWSCFVLGAIATALAVGRLELLGHIPSLRLAAILSVLFVVEFMGFYSGLFALIWKLIEF